MGIRFIFLLGALALTFPTVMNAQSTDDAFHAMLHDLYRQTVTPMAPETLFRASKGRFVVLDTRPEAEYVVSHLPDARRAGYEDFDEATVAGIPRDQPVVVYCTVGYRSERIGERLLALGFTQVFNLYGGIFAWKNQGYPVVDAQGQPTERVHTYNQDWSQWLQQGEKVY